MNIRKIIHVDMDAFFASVEQRDHPEFRGKPVIVGGDPQKRGVVSTCSYEARKFGIHSAMPTSQAVKLCPQGVFIRPRMQIYQAVSLQIQKIFRQYTDLVEPLSLDEAYLDVTINTKGESSATRLAQRIKQQIFKETGLTASAGVSFNKFLAKVASDWKKPDGLTVIPPDKAVEFIEKLPIRKFYGIGEVTERKMLQMGVKTGVDLRKVDREFLCTHFGKRGDFFYRMANCRDNRPVNPARVRKSIGKERTFPEDVHDKEKITGFIHELSLAVSGVLQRHHTKGRTITLKVRYDDFTTVTRRVTLQDDFDDTETISSAATKLLEKTEIGKRLVRLLGVSVSNLKSAD